MAKNKIAESIIIRVGGGIREIYREQVDSPEVIDTYNVESENANSEEIPVLGPKAGSASSNPEEKILN